MTLKSTGDPSSILKDGKIKPGVYKIQNLYHQNYLDVEEHSRKLWCRPARDLEDGKGLVCLRLSSMVRVSDDWKWEIKNLGVGYTVRRVSSPMPSNPSYVG